MEQIAHQTKVLLQAQGVQHGELAEREVQRFLIANRFNSKRTVQALAQRLRFKSQHPVALLRQKQDLRAVWCASSRVLRLVPSASSFVPAKELAWFVGETVGHRLDLLGAERYTLEAWFGNGMQEFLPMLARNCQEQHPGRIKLVRLVNFPDPVATASKLGQLKVEAVVSDRVVVGDLEESLYELPATADDAGEMDEEESLGILMEALETSIQRSSETELIHLQASYRMRQSPAPPATSNSSLVSNELRQHLDNELLELDALKRAVAFAKNFMDLEERERRDFQVEMERTIATKQEENRRLIGRLKDTFGSDATDLLRH
ncbi:hypothetical protein BASA81_006519 [Batrachochytrium salamandrivorans]|nr:hypothetical protein BASA81_006519 [Batrachochytrium salamandrivorans]